ncbi:hypothetical protein D3C71_1440200 [compost metagenome]
MIQKSYQPVLTILQTLLFPLCLNRIDTEQRHCVAIPLRLTGKLAIAGRQISGMFRIFFIGKLLKKVRFSRLHGTFLHLNFLTALLHLCDNASNFIQVEVLQ